MSDSYGVGNALKAFHHSMFMASRRTGRTSRMLEQVKSGDRIVFASEGAAGHVRPLLKEMGKEVECVICTPKDPYSLSVRPPAKGFTHFDHDWVDEYYRFALEQASEWLMKLPREVSGEGVVHAECRLEARRWGEYPTREDMERIPETYVQDSKRGRWL